MARRWLVAMALAAVGCGSAGGTAPRDGSGGDGDAARADAATPNDLVAEVNSDASPDAATDAGDVAAEGGTDARDASVADGDGPGDARAADLASSFCPAAIPTASIGGGIIAGTFKGAGVNPAVGCRGGVITQGPEAFFTLTLPSPVTLDIVVTAPIDTLISIRSGLCTGSISEIACGEDPPAIANADGGPPPASSADAAAAARRTGLRVPLAAGTYTIVVDTLTLSPLASADFTMTLSQVGTLPNATCSTPKVLTSGTTIADQSLDLGGPPSSACGADARTVLYYAVGVPAGQRLAARAVPTSGDRTWMPTMAAFTTCGASGCLALGRLASGSAQEVDWINNGSAWQLVFLTVGADTEVNGAKFDLQVNVADLFATCGRPVAVKDGTMLVGQDLSSAAPVSPQTCSGSSARAFYYAATLLPLQTLVARATPSGGPGNFKFSPRVDIRTTCDSSAECMSSGDNASFTNQTDKDVTVTIEVTSAQQGTDSPFDLSIELPDPPAKILVTPSAGLVTTESGGTATFSVSLTSPPSANVTLALVSDSPTEGAASPASLVFTPASWRTPQTVTVKGLDDQLSDGAKEYTIVTSPAVSDDPRYSALDPADVAATNLDDDPGMTVTGAGDVVTSEAGTTSTFTVTLNAAPTATVTMGLSSSDIGEGTVSPATITFTTASWNVPQTVTVTGVDDAMIDGAQRFTIVTGALASGDPRYAGQDPPDIVAHNLDDDQPAVAVKLLSGTQSCASPQNLPITVDRADTIFIVMSCEGGLWLTTSADAGVTFSVPALIPGTADTNGQSVTTAGGAAGVLYLAATTAAGRVIFLRTVDGGTTWSAPVTLAQSDFVRLRAAGKTVIMLTAGDGTHMRLSRSIDGGRSFLAPTFPRSSDLDLGVEPGGQTAWLVALDGTGDLRKSTDSGATFTNAGSVSAGTGDVRWLGLSHLFVVAGASIQITPFAAPSTSATSTASASSPLFSLTSDELDQLTFLDSEPQTNHLRATHVGPNAGATPSSQIVGPSAGAAGVAALSRNATAVAFLSGNLVLYTTVVWR